MVRRDSQGLTHWANAPTPNQRHTGATATGAFCNPGLNTFGDQWNVSQEGPSCLWCLVVFKKEA